MRCTRCQDNYVFNDIKADSVKKKHYIKADSIKVITLRVKFGPGGMA